MGRRLQTRRDDAESRALFRLTLSYVAVFALVIAALSVVAYVFLDNNYRSIVGPALETTEGRAGFAAAMRPAVLTILTADALLLCAVGAASFVLARSALQPLVAAREREERFSADAAHELRTPLAAIASTAEAVEPGDDRSATVALASIARRAAECGALVGDLLTLARASDAESLQCEVVDLAILTELVGRERAEANRTIALAGTYQSAIVIGDERRLRQLVRNLLDNAYAHARTRIEVDVRVRAGQALLSIADDGPGVDADVVPRLFERFAKGRSSRGSGLGLAIGRWIARAHGGNITYVGGSRFIAALPHATSYDTPKD